MYDVLRTLRRGALYVSAALCILLLFALTLVICRLFDAGAWFAGV